MFQDVRTGRPDVRTGRPVAGLAVLLFAATAGLFWPACGNEFVDFDDDFYVTANPHVLGGLSPSAVSWAATTFHASNWHPLTWWSLQLDAQCFGPQAHGFHRTNVLLHAASAALLLLLLWRLTGAVWRSVLAAALFAMHPLRVESVAWVSERKDVLSCLLLVVTLLAYTQYVLRPTRLRYGLVLAGLALGLMAKPMLVTLPALLLLLDYWPLGRFSGAGGNLAAEARRALLEKIPLAALCCVAALLTVAAQRTDAMQSLKALPLAERIGNASIACVDYLRQTVWPTAMAVFYPHPRQELSWPAAGGAASLLALLTGLAVWQGRRRPYLLVGWLWFVIALLPVIGLIQVGQQARADRYTYIPHIGLCLAVAWAWGDLAARRRWAPAACTALAGVAAAACALTTVRQLEVWRNGRTLWTHTLAVTRNNFGAHAHLADLDIAQGRKAQAVEHLAAALRIWPGNARAEQNVGDLLVELRRGPEALPHYREALRLTPRNLDCRLRLGNLLAELHHPEDACAEFDRVLRMEPHCAEAYAGLGLIALRGGGPAAGKNYLMQAVALESSDVAFLTDLAMRLADQAQYSLAAEVLTQALAVRPASAECHSLRGRMCAAESRWADAATDYREAARLAPRTASYKFYLAHAMSKMGNIAAAEQEYATALALAPHWPKQAAQRAWQMAVDPDPEARSPDRAVQLAEQASGARGGKQPELLDVLAVAYGEAGRFDEAVTAAHQALGLTPSTGQERLAASLREHQELYRQHRTLRPPAPDKH